jgi:hypothetical protein
VEQEWTIEEPELSDKRRSPGNVSPAIPESLKTDPYVYAKTTSTTENTYLFEKGFWLL